MVMSQRLSDVRSFMKLYQSHFLLLVAGGVAIVAVAILAPNGYLSIGEAITGVVLIGLGLWRFLRPQVSNKVSLASLPWIPTSASQSDEHKKP
jgi:hypothetical protein